MQKKCRNEMRNRKEVVVETGTKWWPPREPRMVRMNENENVTVGTPRNEMYHRE